MEKRAGEEEKPEIEEKAERLPGRIIWVLLVFVYRACFLAYSTQQTRRVALC